MKSTVINNYFFLLIFRLTIKQKIPAGIIFAILEKYIFTYENGMQVWW